jgi:hypothetical protein
MDHNKECGDNCGEIASQRMLYFPGRYMSARDFTDEQEYFLSRRYLHNRMLHGWGVVCGVHVYPHPAPSCGKDHVKVDCGIGLDCCGHELVVPKPVVPPPIPWSGRPAVAPPAPAPPPPPAAAAPPPPVAAAPAPPVAAAPPPPVAAAPAPAAAHPNPAPPPPADDQWYPLLCLEYCETEIECVPVLYSERNCDKERREFSRVEEGYQFCWHWVRQSDLVKYHWKFRGGGCPEHKMRADGTPDPCPSDDCYEGQQEATRCCLEPDCPPDHCLPIAWIRADGTSAITAAQIVTLGRPSLRPPAASLTHICSINWPHGGIVSRHQMEQHLRRLEIRFDRRLRKSHAELGVSGARGVNPATFVVQFGGEYEDLDFVTYTEPPHVEHECVAVYPLDPRAERHHHDLPFAYLENQMVFIALKCDFILDCHDIAVDGNHLGGILPSGDGVPGGTFESWFHVVPDHEWERLEHQRQQPQQGHQEERP